MTYKSLSGAPGRSPRISVRVSDDVLAWVDRYAVRHQVDRSTAVRMILEDAKELDAVRDPGGTEPEK
jgi:hypothetical protein